MLSPGNPLPINNPPEKRCLPMRVLPSPETWSGCGHSLADSDGEGRGRGTYTAVANTGLVRVLCL